MPTRTRKVVLFKAGLATVIAGLAVLSQISGFDATHVKSLNWDIVVMLTPYGLIHNFLIQPDSYLRPYYQSPMGAINPWAAGLAFLLSTIALALIFSGRRSAGK